VFLNDILVEMELDTGVSVLVINNATYRNIQQQTLSLPPTSSEQALLLHWSTHQGARITPFKVRYHNKELVLLSTQ